MLMSSLAQRKLETRALRLPSFLLQNRTPVHFHSPEPTAPQPLPGLPLVSPPPQPQSQLSSRGKPVAPASGQASAQGPPETRAYGNRTAPSSMGPSLLLLESPYRLPSSNTPLPQRLPLLWHRKDKV